MRSKVSLFCFWRIKLKKTGVCGLNSHDIARVMNSSFVNIKVDREERPEIDRIYMTFVQLTTRHGGWPLSVWLTPDLHR